MERAINNIVRAVESGDTTGVKIIKAKNTAFHFPIFYCKIPKKYRQHIDMRGMCNSIGIDFSLCMLHPDKRYSDNVCYDFILDDGRECSISNLSICLKNTKRPPGMRKTNFYDHRIRISVSVSA